MHGAGHQAVVSLLMNDPQPLLTHLAGIDGTGLAAFKQFPRLMAHFDLRCLVIPPSDRSTFEQLLDLVEVRAGMLWCPASWRADVMCAFCLKGRSGKLPASC